MPPPELSLKARYIFPVAGPPMAAGVLRVCGDRIGYVGPADRTPDQDFGNAAIVPGFVNAHTHLELSGLRARDLGGGDFVAWLRRVIDARRGQDLNAQTHAIQRGIDASLAAGTTLVGDISTGGRSWRPLVRSPLRATVFCELLGLRSDRVLETATAARQFLEWAGCTQEQSKPPGDTAGDEASGVSDRTSFPDGVTIEAFPVADHGMAARRLAPGLSPHAPYSTHPRLYELAAAWSCRSHLPLCTHLAETREELRLIAHGDGPLRDFLMSLGGWSRDWLPVGSSVADYVSSSGAAHADWLIAHGNYLTDDEIARFANPTLGSGRRSIVYCPRTHFYFGHTRHPYAAMRAAGLNVCLGTDSLASTPSLSMLDEMRFLRRRDPQLVGAAILDMGTLAGARALGRESTCGSLEPGKFADFAVVRLPDRDVDDPHDLILGSDLPVMRTFIGGRVAYHAL